MSKKNYLSNFVRIFSKVILVLFLLIFVMIGTLILSQEGTAPIRTRLLLSYTVEYAVKHFKSKRHLFPEPYLIDLETK